MDSENLFEVNFVILHSLDIVAIVTHYNQGMLTCGTVRTSDSWQNYWSQGFKLCDQEELPCCDTCVKLPCQGHIRHSECGSTSAVLATHCWIQMCLSMSYVLILQHYLRLLAPFCNPTNHLNQILYWGEYKLQVLKFPRMSVKSMTEMLWSTKFHGKLGWLMSHCVESILSTDMSKRNMTNQSSVWWLPRRSYKRQFSSEMEKINWQ